MKIKDLEQLLTHYRLSSKYNKSNLSTDKTFINCTSHYLCKRKLLDKTIFFEMKIDKEGNGCQLNIIFENNEKVSPEGITVAYEVLSLAIDNLVMKDILEEIETD